MRKRRINLYVNDESFETVKVFLESKGQSVSGWLTAMLDEMAVEIQGQPSPLSKPVDEMTVKEFGEVMAYWFGKAKGEEREAKKAK